MDFLIDELLKENFTATDVDIRVVQSRVNIHTESSLL